MALNIELVRELRPPRVPEERRYIFTTATAEDVVGVPRELLFDTKLSAGAVRCYAVMVGLCRNPSWRLNHAGIATVLKVSARQAKRWTAELQDRWLTISAIRDGKRRIVGWEWTLKLGTDQEPLVRRSDTIIELVLAGMREANRARVS